MKVLKVIFYIVVVITIIIVVGSFFLPKTSRVERSVMVSTTDTVAYNYVLDFNRFNEWSP